MADLDTLRPEVREAVVGADKAFNHTGLFAEPYWQTIRAELLRLAKENADLRSVVGERNTIGQRRARACEVELAFAKNTIAVQKNTMGALKRKLALAEAELARAEDAIFQISARLGEKREPDMDDMDWHVQLIARAQFLANCEAELATLKARIAEAPVADANVSCDAEGGRCWVRATGPVNGESLHHKRVRLVVEE